MNVRIEFDPVTCGACGCIYALNSIHCKRLEKSGSVFYCPNGHQLAFDDDEEPDEAGIIRPRVIRRGREVRGD